MKCSNRSAYKVTSLRLGIAALLMALWLVPGLALAHAKLASSSPVQGATVAPGLTTITLNFTEEVSLDQSTAQLMMANGTAVADAKAVVDRVGRKMMTITTPPLAEGKYTVKWHTVTEDDNGITDSTLAFIVATPGTAQTTSSEAQTTAPLPTTGAGDDGTRVVLSTLGVLVLLLSGLAFRRLARS